MKLVPRSAAVLCAVLIACTPAPSVPSDQARPSPAVEEARQPRPRVVFPDGFEVRVEIAADDEMRAQGLMYRDQLRPGTGMLFLFSRDGEHAFWMKNTRIPLDMIWIDASKRIVHVKHGVPPCRVEDCPSYPPGVDSRYVLEVAAGVAKEHSLQTGQLLRFEDVDESQVR